MKRTIKDFQQFIDETSERAPQLAEAFDDAQMPGQIERFGYVQGKPETLAPALKKQQEFNKQLVEFWKGRLKNLAIVFPNMLKEFEQSGGKASRFFLLANGFSAFVLSTLADMKQLIDKLTGYSMKVDKLIIGSHGDGKHLLITTETNKRSSIKNEFLADVKKIIHSNSIIYFTACYGADQLRLLYDAALTLNVKTYAGKGINYAGLGSQEGFYVCKPIRLPQDKVPPNQAYTDKFLLENGLCEPVSKPPFWFVLPSGFTKFLNVGWQALKALYQGAAAGAQLKTREGTPIR